MATWQEKQDALRQFIGSTTYAGPPVEQGTKDAALKKFLGPAGLPSTPQWLAGFPASATADEPSPENPFWEPLEAAGPDNEFETSLDLTRGQRQAQRAARTATRNNERVIGEAGLQQDYEFEQQAQDSGGWTKPLFDMINIFPQVETGFVSELVRTGSAWEAFKQATAEAADALPWLEKDSSAWLTGKEARMSGKGFGNLLNETGYLPPGLKASAVGLVLDILLDPTAWTGKGLVGRALTKGGMGTVAKGIGAVGKAANYLPGTMGSVTKALGGVSQKMLRTQAAQDFLKSPKALAVRGIFENDVVRKQTAAGQRYLLHRESEKAHLDTRVKDVDEAVRGVLKEADPLQRRVLGVFLDHPASTNMVHAQIDEFARVGAIPNDRVIPLKAQADKIRQLYADYGKEATAPENMFLDEAWLTSDYIHHADPMSPQSLEYSNQMIRNLTGKEPKELLHEGQGGGGGGVVGTPQAFQKARTFDSTYERLANGLPVELDAAHALAKRGMQQARAVVGRNLLNHVLTDPVIGATVQSVADLAPRLEFMGGITGWRRTLRQAGNDVVPIYTKGAVSHYAVVPTEIADDLTKAKNFFNNPDAISSLLKSFDKYQSVWKAYAVLTPGFHMRNTLSNHFNMYLAGLPVTQMPKYQGMGMTSMAEAIDHPLLTHLPGAKGAMGAKTRAKALSKGVDQLLFDGKEMGAKITWKPEWRKDGIEVPAGREGQAMTVKEVRDLGYQLGALGNGQTIAETQQEATRTFANVFNQLPLIGSKDFYDTALPRVKDAIANNTTLDPAAIALLKTESNNKTMKSALGLLKDQVVEKVMDNPLTRLNRQGGELLENTDKMALFLHGLDEAGQGLSPVAAAARNKRHLFDYQNLTDTEKAVMKRVIPFYAWLRFNIPLQLESIFHDPGKYSIVPKLQNEIEAMSPEWQDLPTPDYFDELNAVRLPYMRGGKPLYLQPGLPYADLNRIPRPLHPYEDLKKETISAMGPIPKLALSLLANRDFFYNKPIETYPGDMSQEIPGVGKTQQWAIESQAPALQRIMSAYRAAKKSELQPWLLSNVAGVKILPNDISRTTRGHVYGKLAISKVLADKAKMLGKVREKEEEGD